MATKDGTLVVLGIFIKVCLAKNTGIFLKNYTKAKSFCKNDNLQWLFSSQMI